MSKKSEKEQKEYFANKQDSFVCSMDIAESERLNILNELGLLVDNLRAEIETYKLYDELDTDLMLIMGQKQAMANSLHKIYENTLRLDNRRCEATSQLVDILMKSDIETQNGVEKYGNW